MNEAYDFIKMIKRVKFNLQLNLYGNPVQDKYYYKSSDKYKSHKQKLNHQVMLRDLELQY